MDRAALDAATSCGLAIGGMIPKGREAEDGQVPACYAPLTEVTADDEREIDAADIARYYPGAGPDQHQRIRNRLARTRRNVLDSNATLIICRVPLAGGTQATRDYAEQAGRPVRIIDLRLDADPNRRIVDWVQREEISILNVAGPSEHECPGIYDEARQLLSAVFPVMSDRVSSATSRGFAESPGTPDRDPRPSDGGGPSFERG